MRLRIVNCVFSLLFAATCFGGTTKRGFSYESFLRGKKLYHAVTVNIGSGILSAETVHSRRLTSVRNLVDDSQPMVAITGTFFSLSSQRPVADVLVEGDLVAHGSRGTAVGVTWDGNVEIFDKPFKRGVDWTAFRFGLRGGVRVVTSGKVQPNPKAQKFKDKAIWGRAARTGLGLTKSGKLIFFATKSAVTLSELGRAMKSRGVYNGVSLDGGSSTCLYYNGTYVIAPQRKLSNLFLVKPKA